MWSFELQLNIFSHHIKLVCDTLSCKSNERVQNTTPFSHVVNIINDNYYYLNIFYNYIPKYRYSMLTSNRQGILSRRGLSREVLYGGFVFTKFTYINVRFTTKHLYTLHCNLVTSYIAIIGVKLIPSTDNVQMLWSIVVLIYHTRTNRICIWNHCKTNNIPWDSLMLIFVMLIQSVSAWIYTQWAHSWS